MRIIYISIIFSGIMLAILSRKNYSKYKDKGPIKCVLYGMSYSIYKAVKRLLPVSDTRERIGKTKLMPQSKLVEETNSYYVESISICLFVAFAAVALSALLYLSDDDAANEKTVITRQDYGGEESRYELSLSHGDESTIYELGVEPVKYTEEQFEQKSKEVLAWIDTEMLGDNESPDHVHTNLNLMTHDKSNALDIIWRSDKPASISSSGVIRDEAQTGDVVCLTARIEYYDYFMEKVYELKVDLSEGMPDEIFMYAINELNDIEKASVSEKEIVIPDRIGEVEVTVPKGKSNTPLALLFFGMCLCVLLVAKRRSDLKTEIIKRDNMLIRKYTDFVNFLWLFLGTGMTIRSALSNYVEESREKTILSNEIGYYINLINSGADEAATYEELGARLGVKEYRRLFMHISQNLRMGTKDIRNILEEELLTANLARKEFARKKGEEATTKLLVPMIMMLFITMIVVVVPALISF